MPARRPQRKVNVEMKKSPAIALVPAVLLISAWAALAMAEEQPDLALATGTTAAPALKDATVEPLSLSRDGEGAVLRTFTIEGEDRVSIRFDRPAIALDLDPRQAPGLDWQNSWDKVDVLPAVTGRTAQVAARFVGQPWLDHFAQDEVVVFTPQSPEMASWQLTIVDSRGVAAAVRSGQGTPPARLTWNGRRDDGQPAWPGLIYSFVLETEDPAGNRRTTSGRGFGLPAYRLTGEQQDVLVLSGGELMDPMTGAVTPDLPAAPLTAATASWLNQAPGLDSPIEIRATARSRVQAEQLAELMRRALAGRVCGAPDRLVTVVNIVADAPDQGVLEIASRSAD